MAREALLVSGRITLTRAAARERATPRLIAIGLYVSAFAAVGAAAPYLPVYYQSLGLPLDAIGLLAAVAALCGLMAAPVWGVLADQVAGSRGVLVAAAGSAALCGVGLGFASIPAIAALIAVLYALTFAGIGPVLDAYALDQVAEDHTRYARFRVWGSASFVVSTVAVGLLIGLTELRSMFVVLVAMLLVSIVLALAVPARTTSHVQRSFSGLRTVLRTRVLMTFVVAALVAWSASTMVNGFLSIYLISLNAPAALVGGAWAIGAVVEVPMMIAFPALAARFGVKTLVVAGATLLLTRVLVFIVTADPLIVTLAMTLHGAGYALLLVGGVTYVAQYAPEGSAATAQGVLSGVVFGLAQALGPGIAGVIAGATSIPTMFLFAAGASVCGVVALYFAVSRARADGLAIADPPLSESVTT